MMMLNPSAFVNSFFAPSQPDLQGRAQGFGSGPGFSTGAPGDNLFARLLAGKDPDTGPAGTHSAKPVFLAGNGSSAASLRSRVTDNETPVSAALESAFLNHGIFPDNMVLSREDFDFLGNVLKDMGFSRAELTTLFQSIKETRSDGRVTLAHFLEDLSAFEQAEIQTSGSRASFLNDTSFDKSAVPHLELVLRDLGIPSDKMDALLAGVSRENGAIDIENLVLQLKSHAAAMEKSADTSQVSDPAAPRLQTGHVKQGLNPVSGGFETQTSKQWQMAGGADAMKNSETQPPDSKMFQRLASSLEKLGLSVPNKEPHLPYTLENFTQALEKKIGEPVPVSKHVAMDPVRMAEMVMEMPAVKSMKMENTATYFGYAREMMIDKQNKPAEKNPVTPKNDSQDLWSVKNDGGISGDRKTEPRISEMDVQGNDASHKPDGTRRSVQTGVSDQGSEKKVTDHKTGMESRPMPVDNHKPDTEKTAAVLKATADPSPVQGDVSKTDGTVLKETHQNLIPGGEKFQSMGVSYTGAPENLSSPVKQTAAFQQGPLPAAVVNQVGREIAAFVRRGDRFFTLQLKPPELGIVNIEMDVKENALKMSVVTETSSAKDLLHANYVDLKRVLEGYGIRVEAFDVQLNGSLNHASANGDGSLNQQHSQTGMGKNLHFGKSSGETAEENNVGPPVPPGKNSEALLDLLA
jgi:hypothetical protein